MWNVARRCSTVARKVQPNARVRGTKDYFGEEMAMRRHIIDSHFAMSRRYGYEEVSTPILEHTDVFARTLGGDSDIVHKEMYTFADKGGTSVTLRPEGTAGIMRACIEQGLRAALPVRLAYEGPMFRYERPQGGRLRQFHQIGVEHLHATRHPLLDAEAIMLGWELMTKLGLSDRIRIEINCLGDDETRSGYQEALTEYFGDNQDLLSARSRERLKSGGVLRILDSKDKNDQRVVADAPTIDEFLSAECEEHFSRTQELLSTSGIPFRVNPFLVRGLDYYCDTVFEFVSRTTQHAQATVLGGGRYDRLSLHMGGPAAAGVGWAAGLERLAAMVTEPPPEIPTISVIGVPGPASDDPLIADVHCLKTCAFLRRGGHKVVHNPEGSLAKQLSRARKMNARLAILVGSTEMITGKVEVKDFKAPKGTANASVPFKDLHAAIDRLLTDVPSAEAKGESHEGEEEGR